MGKMTLRRKRNSHSSLSERVVSAIGLFGSVEGVKMLCMLVRNKLAAYLIGTAGFGLLGILSNAINLLSALCEMGLLTVGVREIASSAESERPRTIAFILRYGRWLAACGMAVAFALSPLLSYCIFGSMAYTVTFMFAGVAVACNILASSYRAELQGESRLSAIARAVIWSTVIGLALAVVFLWLFRDDGVMPMLVSYSIVLFLSFLYFGRSSRPLPEISVKEVRSRAVEAVRLGMFLTLSGICTWLSSLVLMAWINREGNAESAGLYQVGQTLTVGYVGVVFTALSIEFFPRISSAVSAGRNRVSVMMRHEAVLSVIVVTALCALLIPLAPWVVSILYNQTFTPVVPMIVWACPGIILRAVSWSMAYVLVADGRGRIYLATEIASAILCVLIMGAGFKFFGMTGLGVGFTIWYLCYTMMIWGVLRHVFHIGLGSHAGSLCFAALLAVMLTAASSQLLPLAVTAIISAATFLAAAVVLYRKLM